MSKNVSRRSQRMPHYAEPNIATVLPVYVNSEQDYVKQTFSVGNFRSISSLPTELKTNNVNESRANHADNNITSAIMHAPHGSYKQFGKGATPNFSYFHYEPSEYSLTDELKSKQAKEHKDKRTELCKQEWIYSSTQPKPSVLQNQAKHEHEKQYHDPYEDAANVDLRVRWLEDAKILHGPFVPSQKDNSLKGGAHRGLIPDMMRRLAREVDSDWEDAEFQIYRDEEDLVIIEFNMSSIDSKEGLNAYMNILTNNNPVVSENGLSKIVELWNHQPGDGSVYYAFKGPWTKRSGEEAYYTLHPERRNFRALQDYKNLVEKNKQKEGMQD